MEMYIVLGVTLFMMVSFVLHKVPFGVTTMTCCAILAVTGVVDLQTAFSGFGNKIVVLIAPILALSAVLPRTSMIAKISTTLNTLMPKDDQIDQSAFKHGKNVEMLSRSQELIVYAVFAMVMLMMLLNQWTGNLLYLAPGIGILILIYTKIAKVEDVVKNMTSDMVWMIAGVLVVADALGKSGAGNLIGQFILVILGENPSSMFVMLIFSAATVIMTTFLSNMATQTILIPIAASVALAGGWDPRGIILAIGTANMLAIGFPSGSGEAAVCYAAGGYNPARVMKFTVPYIILGIISSAIAANLMYPIYG